MLKVSLSFVLLNVAIFLFTALFLHFNVEQYILVSSAYYVVYYFSKENLIYRLYKPRKYIYNLTAYYFGCLFTFILMRWSVLY